MRTIYSVAIIQSNLTSEFLDRDDYRELHGFCEIKGLSEDTPDEENVLINVSEVPHGIIEFITVTQKKTKRLTITKVIIPLLIPQ